MKNTISIIVIFLFSYTLKAQSPNVVNNGNEYIGKITLSVISGQNPDNFSSAILSKFKSKITSVTSRYGIAATDYVGGFAIVSDLHLYNEKLLEGMENIFVLDIEVHLSIKQFNTNLIFSNYDAKLKGTGNSKDEAINNALSQINIGDNKLKMFIEEGKTKVIQFYNSKCNDIITEADKYAGMGEYDRALAILMSVPTEATPCNEKIKTKSLEIFKSFQQKECRTLLQLAKTEVVQKAYVNALRTLSLVDVTSSCYNETQSSINTIESKIDTELRRQWEIEKEKMKNRIELEKMQLESMKSVAGSFLGGKGGSLFSSILGFLF